MELKETENVDSVTTQYACNGEKAIRIALQNDFRPRLRFAFFALYLSMSVWLPTKIGSLELGLNFEWFHRILGSHLARNFKAKHK